MHDYCKSYFHYRMFKADKSEKISRTLISALLRPSYRGLGNAMTSKGENIPNLLSLLQQEAEVVLGVACCMLKYVQKSTSFRWRYLTNLTDLIIISSLLNTFSRLWIVEFRNSYNTHTHFHFLIRIFFDLRFQSRMEEIRLNTYEGLRPAGSAKPVAIDGFRTSEKTQTKRLFPYQCTPANLSLREVCVTISLRNAII